MYRCESLYYTTAGRPVITRLRQHSVEV